MVKTNLSTCLLVQTLDTFYPKRHLDHLITNLTYFFKQYKHCWHFLHSIFIINIKECMPIINDCTQAFIVTDNFNSLAINPTVWD